MAPSVIYIDEIEKVKCYPNRYAGHQQSFALLIAFFAQENMRAMSYLPAASLCHVHNTSAVFSLAATVPTWLLATVLQEAWESQSSMHNERACTANPNLEPY